jgi:hypothetical protein
MQLWCEGKNTAIFPLAVKLHIGEFFGFIRFPEAYFFRYVIRKGQNDCMMK